MTDFDLRLGDCLEVSKAMESETVSLVLTDPPYGINYQSARRSDKALWKPKIANDNAPFTAWLPEAYRVTADGGALLCFCRWDVQEVFRLAIEQVGYKVKSVIWDKQTHGMGDLKGEFAPRHEVILFAVKGAFAFPGKRPTTLISVPRVPPEKLLHPNEKPVNLLQQLIRTTTVRGDLVADFFTGSGSTPVAAVLEGRRFVGSEIDPSHYQTAMRRLEAAKRQPQLFELA
jgi:DNA modification methylase